MRLPSLRPQPAPSSRVLTPPSRATPLHRTQAPHPASAPATSPSLPQASAGEATSGDINK